MRIAFFLFALGLPIFCLAQTTHPATLPTVDLQVEAERYQPREGPVIIDVTIKNIGSAVIEWWCVGLTLDPPSQSFIAQFRYELEEVWKPAVITNGQDGWGTPSQEKLRPFESRTIHLAVPIEPGHDCVTIKLAAREWVSLSDPEGVFVELKDDESVRDQRRARILASALSEHATFEWHLAQDYGDPVVNESLAKMATINNPQIAGKIADVLESSRTLNAIEAQPLAASAAYWMSLIENADALDAGTHLLRIALRAHNESALRSALQSLQNSKSDRLRSSILADFGLASGDLAWITKMRDGVFNLTRRADVGSELKKEAEWALGNLDAQIEALREKEEKH